MKSVLKSPIHLLLILVSLWMVFTFLIWPNINLLHVTFAPDGKFSFDAYERLTKSKRAMAALRNSVVLAFALSVTANVVGVFIVLVTKFYRIRGSRFVWLAYATTFIYGGVVLAAGYKFVYGSDGLITDLLKTIIPGLDPEWFGGFWAVLFTMTLATTTNHMLFVTAALNKLDYQTVEAAKNMGAGDFYILRRVVLPTLLPVLLAVTILLFLTGLGALSAPQILGGREFQTIAPIVLTFSTSGSSRDLAALLAIFLGVITIVLLAIFNRIERTGLYFSVSKVSSALVKQKISNPVTNVIVHALAYLLALLYLLPVLLIIAFSFQPPKAVNTGKFDISQFTVENYVRVLTQDGALRPFLVSVIYALLASVVVAALMLLAAHFFTKYNNWITEALEYLLHIPWILPTTMIALGLIMSYDHATPLLGGRVLTGTATILLCAYVIVKIPFTLRLLKSAFAGINNSLLEAATLMGAHPFYAFRRIIFPAVLPATAAVTALNFNSLLDDYDAAVFLAHPLFQPLGLVIQANTADNVGPEAKANTFVYTVLLMIIASTTMYLIYGRSTRSRNMHKTQKAHS
ncbi:ABC transporter permease [Corynebacterium epidermidicanis]|uniref:ABC-type Fe3+ transport system, permease component n=1 Tax=Corynebacterium epidermidicanis TaxID=1050174 RepID=A0A0G3GW42_9CORY|nr:ABC transporter permease subunit [Corynebacterium epidermidicanis]AKK03728.1 ABC-type Fe3+ transport system, permease component [Corynebacterium epidermidicanis]